MTDISQSDLGVNDRYCLKWWEIDAQSLNSINPLLGNRKAVCLVSFSEMELQAIRFWLMQNQSQAAAGLISTYADSDVGGFDNLELSIVMHDHMLWSFKQMMDGLPKRTHAVQINSTDPYLIQRLRNLEWEINVKVFSGDLGEHVVVSGSEEHIFEIIMGLANETVYERVDTD